MSGFARAVLAGLRAGVRDPGERPRASGAEIDREDSQALGPIEAPAGANISGRARYDDAAVELAGYVSERDRFEGGPRGV